MKKNAICMFCVSFCNSFQKYVKRVQHICEVVLWIYAKRVLHMYEKRRSTSTGWMYRKDSGKMKGEAIRLCIYKSNAYGARTQMCIYVYAYIYMRICICEYKEWMQWKDSCKILRMYICVRLHLYIKYIGLFPHV